MTAFAHLFALLAVACCLVAVLTVSASTLVISSELGPDGVSSPPKIADDPFTGEEKTQHLQELFNEVSKQIFGYLKSVARRKIAEDIDGVPSDSDDIETQILARFRRAADSTTGGHHEHHPDHGTDPTAGAPGYPPAASPGYPPAASPGYPPAASPGYPAAAAPTPVLVSEIPHQYANAVPAPVPVKTVIPAALVQYAPPPSPQYGPPPQYAAPPSPQYGAPPPSPQYGAPPQYAAPPSPQYGAPPQYAPPSLYAPPTVRTPRPVYWSPPPLKAKSFPEIWEFFVTKPLEESYNDFLAYIPVNALYSIVFEHQYFDFESLRAYTANRFGFISAMQNVFHAPSEQLDEIGRFFDMMTRVLPNRFFGEGRSVEDLIREIRLYFAANYPLLQFLAPPRNSTTHYYAK